MIVGFILVILQLSISINGATNLALNKPTYTTPLSDTTLYTQASINDGIIQPDDSCASYYSSILYVVIDLQAVTSVTSIIVNTITYGASILSQFQIAATNTWRTCNAKNLDVPPACTGSIKSGTSDNVMIFNTTGSCTGRFLIFRLKQYTDPSWLEICEFQVFGQPTANMDIINEGNTCQVVSAAQNLLLNKPIYISNNYFPNLMNDGNNEADDIWDHCYYSPAGYSQSVVIDMGSSYLLSYLRIWNSLDPYQYGANYTVNVAIGNQFTALTMDSDLQSFQPMESNIRVIGPSIEINGTGNAFKGQYIYIYTNDNVWDYFTICEVEATGIPIIYSSVPIINSVPINPITSANLVMAPAIRAGVKTVYLDIWSSYVIFTMNCEPIIWDQVSRQSFGIICKYGKGYALVFAKEGFFQNTLNNATNTLLKTNIYKFISPSNSNPRIISQVNITTSLRGDIVYYDITTPISNTLQQIFLNSLSAGNITLVFETTYWQELSYTYYRNNYEYLIEALQIDFTGNIINWSPTLMTISDSDYSQMFISTNTSLQRMLQNNIEFLNNGEIILTMLNGFQSYMTNPTLVQPLLSAIIQKYTPYITYYCPSTIIPLQHGNPETAMFAYNQAIINQVLINSGIKSPCNAIYPGDFPSGVTVNKMSTQLSINGTIVSEYHSTGYFLAAGDTLTYSVINQTGNWDITIGCQIVNLQPAKGIRDVYRLPYITINNIIIDSQGSVFSPFGGVIWIRNNVANTYLNIKINNVVQSPFFNLRDPNGATLWAQRQNSAQGLFTELQGNHLTICVDSSVVQNYNYTYLSTLFNTVYDMSVQLDSQMMAKDILSVKPLRITVDIQTPYYALLSGYPITLISQLNDDIFDTYTIWNGGAWGIVHEIGHTFQESIMLFSCSLEKTVNIFTLFNYDQMWSWNVTNINSVVLSPSEINLVVGYLSQSTVNYTTWCSDNFYALEIYAHLAYNFGWGLYQNFFQIMRAQTVLPTSDQDILDFWFIEMSNITNFNLQPIFDFWGVPVSVNASKSQANRTCYFPNDVFVQLSSSRAALINTQYLNKCTNTPPTKLVFQTRAMKTRPNDISSM